MNNFIFIVAFFFGAFIIYLIAQALFEFAKVAFFWLFDRVYKPWVMAIVVGAFFVWLVIILVNSVPR